MVTLPLFLLFFLAVDEQSQVILVDQDTRKARVRTFYCRFWQVSSPQSRAYAQRGARALLGWQRRSRIVLQGSCLSSPLPNCLCVSIMMMAMAYCYLALPSHFVSTSQLSSPFPFHTHSCSHGHLQRIKNLNHTTDWKLKETESGHKFMSKPEVAVSEMWNHWKFETSATGW